MQPHQTAGMALASFAMLTSLSSYLVGNGLLTHDEVKEITTRAHADLGGMGSSFTPEVVRFARGVLEASISAMEMARRCLHAAELKLGHYPILRLVPRLSPI